MHAVVVYESMYGNTHLVADQIAQGLKLSFENVTVVPVGEATTDLIGGADLLVVGGPTHAHGMSRDQTRHTAAQTAESRDDLDLEPDADGPGLREWFDNLPTTEGRAAAAFDSRVDGPPVLTGRASKAISRKLKRRGYRLVAEPESFLVDRADHLLDGEAIRAAQWGETLEV